MPDDGEPFARIENYPPPKRRFNPIRFRDIKLRSGLQHLVKGLIPLMGLVVVWGPPKCGKTFWVFDLVMHIALGWLYRGRRVRQGTVCYVACEGEQGLAARKEAFQVAKLSEAEQEIDPPFYLLSTRLDLVADVEELIGDIRAAVGAIHCAVVVIDTLNRSIAGSESRDEDMGNYVKAADRLAEALNAAIIIIHHCGTNGERPRGHTSLTGAADAQIAVKRDKNNGQVVATLEWMKDGPEGDAIASTLEVVEVGDDEDGEPITSCVVDDAELAPDRTNRRLPPAQSRALELLSDAIARDGLIPPASGYIPDGVACTTENNWREYCYRGGISNGDQNAKRMAFNRSASALVAAGRIGKWDPWVWITSK